MPAGVTVGSMSFDEGMRLFRSGDVPGACEQFHQAVVGAQVAPGGGPSDLRGY